MQALRRSGHSAGAAHSICRGISATAFTRNLLRLSRLLWCSQPTMSFKTAHSLLSRFLRSPLPESQFSALMKARRFLRSHSCHSFWAGTESCCKTHSWPLKKVMLKCFTTRSTSSWYTRTPVSPLSCKTESCNRIYGKTWYTKWGTMVAQWLRCCATNQKVAGLIPVGVIEIFHWHNPSDRTMALGRLGL